LRHFCWIFFFLLLFILLLGFNLDYVSFVNLYIWKVSLFSIFLDIQGRFKSKQIFVEWFNLILFKFCIIFFLLCFIINLQKCFLIHTRGWSFDYFVGYKLRVPFLPLLCLANKEVLNIWSRSNHFRHQHIFWWPYWGASSFPVYFVGFFSWFCVLFFFSVKDKGWFMFVLCVCFFLLFL